MQRLRGHQHHVVGDVDDVVDRPHPGADQPRLEPERRRPDLDVGEHPRREARAELRHLDRDRGVVGDLPFTRRLGVLRPGRLRQVGVGDRVNLPGHSVDAEAVDAVGGRFQLDHRVGYRDHLGERRPGRDTVLGEDSDPIRVVADLELGLREDHSVRLDAAQLRLAELGPVRHHGPGQRHGNRLAGRDVRRAADDRARAVARVDLADAQLVRVGMLLDRQHPPHDEGVRRWRTDVADPLDLDAVHGELVGEFLHREPGIAVAPQPGVRDLHRNCSRSRTSFSKNFRRSGTPYLSIAIRSIPIPKANPWISSGS